MLLFVWVPHLDTIAPYSSVFRASPPPLEGKLFWIDFTWELRAQGPGPVLAISQWCWPHPLYGHLCEDFILNKLQTAGLAGLKPRAAQSVTWYGGGHGQPGAHVINVC